MRYVWGQEGNKIYWNPPSVLVGKEIGEKIMEYLDKVASLGQ